MTRKLIWILGSTLLCGLVAPHAYSQRGIGDYEGLAQHEVKPDIVSRSGILKGIVIEKCEKTTGSSITGAHILLISDEGTELNVHLGPANAVRHAADRLVVGQKVTAEAFRTEKMFKNHLVATSLTVDDQLIALRGENLRPVWAGGRRGLRGSGHTGGIGPAWGGGQAGGRSLGWGGGAGRSRRQGAGFAQSSWREGGAGYGRGLKQGRGNRYRHRRGQ